MNMRFLDRHVTKGDTQIVSKHVKCEYVKWMQPHESLGHTSNTHNKILLHKPPNGKVTKDA